MEAALTAQANRSPAGLDDDCYMSSKRTQKRHFANKAPGDWKRQGDLEGEIFGKGDEVVEPTDEHAKEVHAHETCSPADLDKECYISSQHTQRLHFQDKAPGAWENAAVSKLGSTGRNLEKDFLKCPDCAADGFEPETCGEHAPVCLNRHCYHSDQHSEKSHFQSKDSGDWENQEKVNETDGKLPGSNKGDEMEKPFERAYEGTHNVCSCPTGHDSDCYLSRQHAGKRHYPNQATGGWQNEDDANENDAKLNKGSESSLLEEASENKINEGAVKHEVCESQLAAGLDEGCYVSDKRSQRRHFANKTHSSIFDDHSKENDDEDRRNPDDYWKSDQRQ